MKFYYEGQLVRTSKTHAYKYAAMLDGKCLKCSATKEGAQAEITRLANSFSGNVEFYEAALQALEKGRDMVRTARSGWVKLDASWYTPENLQRWKADAAEHLAYLRANAKVVALEARD